MTEQEWLTTREVGDMESHLFDTHRFSKRKMRLVSIEACKHVAHLLPPALYAPLIEWAEQYSDGLAGRQVFLSLSLHLPAGPVSSTRRQQKRPLGQSGPSGLMTHRMRQHSRSWTRKGSRRWRRRAGSPRHSPAPLHAG
jgi:hypothetical protein